VTPNPGFKVTGYLKVEYLADGATDYKADMGSTENVQKWGSLLNFWLKRWKVFYTSDGN